MKAIRIHETGKPACLREECVPEPEPAADEFLVRVHAAGVNPVDTKIRAGNFARFHPMLPAVIGRDISGTIVGAGRNASGFSIGEAVFGLLDYDRGAYAELVLASSRELARKPAALTHRVVAALPVAALTAWQALFEHGKLRGGKRVLIHGASGGVGHLAVQFAVWCGAAVYATCRGDDREFVGELGATGALDYRTARFEKEMEEIDLVLDLIGGETRHRSWQTLKPGGILVSTLPEPTPPDGRTDVSGREVVVYGSSEQLAAIASLVAAGQVKVCIDHEFMLSAAAAAHDHLEREHVRGKIVLLVS
jgi:NADPH:quinone reductase-like Zn-dependent oxidoreductase